MGANYESSSLIFYLLLGGRNIVSSRSTERVQNLCESLSGVEAYWLYLWYTWPHNLAQYIHYLRLLFCNTAKQYCFSFVPVWEWLLFFLYQHQLYPAPLEKKIQ